MEMFVIPGNVRETSLRFERADGGVLMAVTGPGGGDIAVVLDLSWLRPLAAWFAGEAQPGFSGDCPGALYDRALTVHGDEEALIRDTRTWARLDCRLPFGTARVTIGPHGRGHGWSVMIPPVGRAGTAARLRRMDADSWATGPGGKSVR